MHANVLASLIAVAISAPAVARSNGAFVVKQSYAGFVAPDYIRNEKCELYADHVVITKDFGPDNSLVERRAITLTGDVGALIERATGETVTSTPNLICDGPSTTILTYRGGDGDTPTGPTLFQTGGCGTPTEKRDGGASQILTAIIDNYCPTTYQAARP